MLDLLAPLAAAGLDPAVQRGLGFFEQRQPGKARGLAGLGRQLARGGVERCRDGDGDVLLGKRGLGVGLLPGAAQMLEIAGGSGQRRDAADFLGRIGGENAGAAIDAGVAEPALGAADQTDGRGRAAAAGEFAGDEVAGRAGQAALGLGQLALVRQIEKGRQQGLASTLPGAVSWGMSSTPCTTFSPSLAVLFT
jgi:hypothetical protein